jgi:hypothetical protein
MTSDKRKELFTDFTDNMAKILISKGNDYATQDVLSNFKLAGNIANQKVNNPSAINCLNLIATKVARLGNLLSSEGDIKNESVEDSVLDMANYTFLLFCILKEGKEDGINEVRRFWQNNQIDFDELNKKLEKEESIRTFTISKLIESVNSFSVKGSAPSKIEINLNLEKYMIKNFEQHAVFSPSSKIAQLNTIFGLDVEINEDLADNEYILS